MSRPPEREPERRAGRTLTRRALLGASAGTAAALALAACTPPSTTAPGTNTPATGTPAPKKGGTLTIDIGVEKINSLDPESARTTADDRAIALIAERMLARDLNFKPSAGLFTTWKPTADLTAWTAELRKGVKFSDGTVFDAQTIKANFDRWSNPRSTSSYRTNFQALVSSMDIIDDYTVRFNTKGRRGTFETIFAAFMGHVVHPKQSGDDRKSKIMGTGPFMVESFVPGERLDLVRNPDYWGGAPLLDKVVFRGIPEPGARAAALSTGDADVSLNMPATQIAGLKTDARNRIVNQPSLSQRHLVINAARVLNTPQARIAINLATDAKELGDVAYEGFFAPTTDGTPTNPYLYKPDASLTGFKYDPDRARTLLQQAGLAGAKLDLVYAAAPEVTRLAQLLQAQYQKVGLVLNPVVVEQAGMAQRLADGAFDLNLNQTGFGLGAPLVWQGLLETYDKNPGGNPGKWGTAETNRLLEAMVNEVDQAKVTTSMNDFMRLYFADPAWVTLGAVNNTVVYRDHVQGFVYHPSLYVASWIAGAWLNK